MKTSPMKKESIPYQVNDRRTLPSCDASSQGFTNMTKLKVRDDQINNGDLYHWSQLLRSIKNNVKP